MNIIDILILFIVCILFLGFIITLLKKDDTNTSIFANSVFLLANFIIVFVSFFYIIPMDSKTTIIMLEKIPNTNNYYNLIEADGTNIIQYSEDKNMVSLQAEEIKKVNDNDATLKPYLIMNEDKNIFKKTISTSIEIHQPQ